MYFGDNYMELYDLKTDGMITPIGVDTTRIAFSWKISSEKRGAAQTAYRLVIRDENGVVYDSETVQSDQSTYVEYDGKPLEYGARYFWSVTVWDGETSASSSSWFETCLGYGAAAWSGAKWIGSPARGINTAAVDDFSVSFSYKSDKLRLAVCVRDKDNFILFEITDASVDVYDVSDGAAEYSEKYKRKAASHICRLGGGEHTLLLRMNEGKASLAVDGKSIMSDERILPRDTSLKPRRLPMSSVGFDQRDNAAVIKNLKIETRGILLFGDDSLSEAYPKLGEKDGNARIIENDFALICPVAAVNLRKRFTADKNIKSARLYASARGMYNAYINGNRVGEDFYSPGFTDFNVRIQYQTYDVTDMLRNGTNTLSAVVGKGHYSGYCGYSGAMIYGEENSFIAKLVVKYENGDEKVIVTDGMWEYTADGALCDSDYFDGERYDARREYDPCDAADSRWIKCGVKDTDTSTLCAQKGESARIVKTLNAKFVRETPEGGFIFDMGENMVGAVRVKLNGKRGCTIKIRYGEMLEKGRLYVKNLRSAANTDVYTLRGENDVYVPSFSSHGFRYAEISGCGEKIDIKVITEVTGLTISNISRTTGLFECSNPLVNRLYRNILNSQRSNSLLVLTDCPQRNERMGWTGDAQVFARTGAYCADTKTFTEKWLADLSDAQKVYNKNGAVPDTAPLGGDCRADGCGGWGDAAVIVPWEMYRAYGDKRILERCYYMMKKWVDYQSRADRQNCGLRIVDGTEVPEQSDMSSEPFLQVQQRRGDHLAYDCSTPYIYTATAYAAHSSDLLSRIAGILKKTDDEVKYRKRFEDIRRAFREAWVKEDGSIAYHGEMSAKTPHCGEAVSTDGSVTRYTYYSENSPSKPSQTAYALAIAFDLLPKETLAASAGFFNESVVRAGCKLTVGFLGISHLAPALTKAGFPQTAFRLLEQEENPSWLYSVKNGATTIWERWDSYIAESETFSDASMNSFNHYAYGSVGEWLFDTVLGIKPMEAGYKKFMLAPVICGTLTFANGEYECPYGRIKSSWKQNGGFTEYEFAVPPNTSALVCFPDGETLTLVSGKYRFRRENTNK